MDVHMMVIEPEKLVEPFAKAGADNITFHIEATNDPDGIIELIKSCGCKVGVSIKPKTPLTEIFPRSSKSGCCAVMSVGNPDLVAKDIYPGQMNGSPKI
ncbi:MAG: hypothetical protein Ct9H300mP29_7880 [Candidatus Neomarinimicrobiota bacterium]|nr:MAG: hypothetical protein Ct9H300mP29_7880 [Candidatus Neomarinimicrobiota bacterium]